VLGVLEKRKTREVCTAEQWVKRAEGQTNPLT